MFLAGMTVGYVLLGFALLAGMAAGYLWPTIVAHRCEHRDRELIKVVNVLLGWTLVGWVVAMAWAVNKR
jgi:hypothetical protein